MFLTLVIICLVGILLALTITPITKSPDPGTEVSKKPIESLPPDLPIYIINLNWRTRWVIYGDGLSIQEETITDEIFNMNYSDRSSEYQEFNIIGYKPNCNYFSLNWDSLWLYPDYLGKFTGSIEGEDSCYVGERSIVRRKTGERTVIWVDGRSRKILQYEYKLMDTNNNVLAQGFSHLAPDNREVTAANGFIGIRDEQIELLDYDGRIIKSIEKPPEVYEISALVKGIYAYSTSDTDISPELVRYREALLGPDLSVLIPSKTYYQIQLRRYHFGDTPVELLFCVKFIRTVPPSFGRPGRYWIYSELNAGESMSRTDIYSISGELMIENLTSVFDVTPNRIAVIQGAYGGLIDWSGNWIVKKPIFTDLIDD
jgi:hypothetical protein